MSRRIYFDGLNLSLERGTGIATYTRLLAGLVRQLGYDVGVVYSSPYRPAKNPVLREIAFFDPNNAAPVPRHRRSYNWAIGCCARSAPKRIISSPSRSSR